MSTFIQLEIWNKLQNLWEIELPTSFEKEIDLKIQKFPADLKDTTRLMLSIFNFIEKATLLEMNIRYFSMFTVVLGILGLLLYLHIIIL